MKYVVYTVHAEANTYALDCDGVSYKTSEPIFDDMFSSKVKAIAKAQSLFAKRADWAFVREVVITENGIRKGKRIYNLINK